MKLYYMPGACSLATHIVLEWVGADYDTHRLSHAQLKQDEFLAINPAGAVPTLDIGGWVLTQNTAILNYLADAYPEAKLAGDGSLQSRAEVERWLGFVNSDLHPAYKPLFGATAYLDDTAAIDQSKTHARKTVRTLLERANTQLQGKDWIAGSRSIADAYLFVMVNWAKMQEIDLAGLDDLERFFQHMKENDAVRKALADEGLA